MRQFGKPTLIALSSLLLASPAFAQSAPNIMAESPLSYVVRSGDTLIELARTYLNKPSDYRRVQTENSVRNPRRMATGRTLTIPTELLRTRTDTAQLESYRGDVEVLRGQQRLSLSTGMTLLEGDSLSTGRNAFARIALSDGSFAVVPSNSRIRLDRIRRFEINDAPDHHISVQSGRLENSVSPRVSPGGYRVTSPAAVSAVRGTDFRVTYNEANGTGTMGVLEGRVESAASTGGDSLVAEAGSGTVARLNDSGLVAATLLNAPSLIAPEKIQIGETVVFEANAPQGTAAIRGRIGNDTGLTNPVAEADSATSKLEFEDLDEGRWFIRLSSVSDAGLEGRARTYDFIRARNGVEGLALAQANENGFRTYRFAWRGVGEGEARFRFQLWRVNAEGEAEGPLLVDHLNLEENSFTLTDLPAGDYAWRVEGVRYRFGHRLAAWSSAEQLTISR